MDNLMCERHFPVWKVFVYFPLQHRPLVSWPQQNQRHTSLKRCRSAVRLQLFRKWKISTGGGKNRQWTNKLEKREVGREHKETEGDNIKNSSHEKPSVPVVFIHTNHPSEVGINAGYKLLQQDIFKFVFRSGSDMKEWGYIFVCCLPL